MEEQKVIIEELIGLKKDQKQLIKAVYANTALANQAEELGESMKAYTAQLATYTGKVEVTLGQTSQALQVLQRLTEGETLFAQALQQYSQGSKEKSEAFVRFVESMTLHKDTYERLEKRLSRSMETLDEDAKKYLATRRQQLDKLYDESLAQFENFVEAEVALFDKSIAQLKPEGLHHAIEQLELLTPIYEYLKQLDLSEEGASALVAISTKLDDLNNEVDAFKRMMLAYLNKKDQKESEREMERLKEVRSFKLFVIFQPIILMVFALILFGLLGLI